MNVLSSLTLLPVAPWPLLVLFAAAAAGLIWLPPRTHERREPTVAKARRSAMVALLLVAALRPALPGNDVRVDATAADVYFVVDTTSSAMARDYADGRPRLEGVRADVKGIAEQLPGARYSVLSFDVDTITRLPLTSDPGALDATMDTLRAETSVYSRGSSVTQARDQLRTALQRGRESHPERLRLVFYLGDGEQTASGSPQPFIVDGLVNGGAVLGYGTSAGGRMAITGGVEQGDIEDPTTGQPALSVIDEQELRTIASQLGVPYLHRTTDDGAAAIVDAVHLGNLASVRAAEGSDVVGGRLELGWVALLLVALLAAWEIGSLLAAATGASGGRRGRRRGMRVGRSSSSVPGRGTSGPAGPRRASTHTPAPEPAVPASSASSGAAGGFDPEARA